MTSLDIAEATQADAPGVAEVIHRSFASRPPVDPPADALTETPEAVADALEASGGLEGVGAAAQHSLVRRLRDRVCIGELAVRPKLRFLRVA